MTKKQKAFTLIEMLVIIAIIAMLATIVLVAVNSSRAKARDAKRATHIRSLQTALEMYANNNNGVYPASSIIGSASNATTWNTFITTNLVNNGYLGSVPLDPKQVWPYEYYYLSPGNYTYCDGGRAHAYELIFATETTTVSGFPLYGIQNEGGNKARYCAW